MKEEAGIGLSGLKTGAPSGLLRVSRLRAALYIMTRCQDDLMTFGVAQQAPRKGQRCPYVLIFVHPKLKNTLLYEPIIQIKFRLHRYVSYDKIFKTRPHLIIFR